MLKYAEIICRYIISCQYSTYSTRTWCWCFYVGMSGAMQWEPSA